MKTLKNVLILLTAILITFIIIGVIYSIYFFLFFMKVLAFVLILGFIMYKALKPKKI